ncbi:uncharacterized protein LOC133891534 [Phragmites australis]|uniref:uncharacterized protein LOC133891534 n=1 Tax=Phragmites australis TaxID=29695 RepID=UPI002D787FEC|nr:uncharacterized protein LOC133891534 [Phragmites australis]
MTLAEMQLLLSKRRGTKDQKAPKSSSRCETEEEDDEEVAEENNHSELMAVEDSDFYNFDAVEEGNAGRRKYDIAVFLSGYNELYGPSFGYLEKVEGFRSIFTRRDVGSHAVHTLQKGDLGALSHQIPASKVSKGEGSTLPPGNCWELDLASLPAKLLRVGPRK